MNGAELTLNDLSDYDIYNITDYLFLPELYNLACTCSRLHELLMVHPYRSNEKFIFSLPDSLTDKVELAAQANSITLLHYLYLKWTGDGFWEYVALGSAIGGHLNLMKMCIKNCIKNPEDSLSVAISFCRIPIIEYLLSLNIRFNDECTISVITTKNEPLFIYMFKSGNFIPLRDFPIICLGKDYDYINKAIDNLPDDFFSYYNEEADPTDYFDVISVCICGPEFIITKIIKKGFREWDVAAALSMEAEQSDLVLKFIEKIIDPTDLKSAYKAGIRVEFVDGLNIIISKFPILRTNIIYYCNKYEKEHIIHMLKNEHEL